MSAPSDWDAYSYAKFLVDLFPDDAIEILCERSSCDVIKLVEQRVDRACIKLGGGSKNEIKGMVESRRWDDLQALRVSPTPSATTPRDHRRTGTGRSLPPTPSSTASGSPQSQRIPSYEWIFVYHTEDPVRLTARPSGSEEYLIGEDKLERFQGLAANWTIPPKKVTLGGQLIEVAKNVHLTWNRPGDAGTNYKQFWVVRPELIRHADVLLGGYRKQSSRDGQDKAMSSPLSLDPQASRIPPPAPTPPQHPGLYQGSSSTAIYSNHNSPTHGFGQAPSHIDMAMPNHHPLRPSGRTATMNSGPPSFHNPPSQPPSIMDRPPSRPQSASSTRTTKASKLDTVLVQLSFEGMGKRLLPLDLTKNGDEIIPYLEPHILKMSGKQLDRSIHEMEITSLKENDSGSQSSSLSEDGFDYVWDAMVEFMRENRASGASKKPEFRLDIIG